MIYVTYSPDVKMRLVSFEFFLGHDFLLQT